MRTVEIVFVNGEAKSTARACIALLILSVSGFACLGELGATAAVLLFLTNLKLGSEAVHAHRPPSPW